MLRRDFLSTAASAIGGFSLAHMLGSVAGASHQWQPTQFISIKEFGATGDGNTDDTNAIQEALDAAASSGGGVVFLPAGTYQVTNTLGVASGVRVMGAGPGATIVRLPLGDVPGKLFNGTLWFAGFCMAGATGAGVENLTVDLYTNGSTSNGIQIVPDGGGTLSENCWVRHCEVLGYGGHQYLIWIFQGQQCSVLYNRVDGKIATNLPSSQQEGIEVFAGTDVLILGNTVENVGRCGIYVTTDSEHTAVNHGIRILSNRVQGGQCGIQTFTTTGPGNLPLSLSHVQIKDNEVYQPWDNGIESINAAGVSVTNLLIDGNIVKYARQGIRIYGETGTIFHNVLITDNAIEDAQASADAGSILLHGVQNTVVSSNMLLRGLGSGIAVLNCSGIQVQGNRSVQMSQYAVAVYDSQRVLVSGNVCKDYNQANTGYAGVYSVGSSDVLVFDNQFETTKDYYAVWFVANCDLCKVTSNHLTYASSVNPPFRHDGTNANIGSITFTAGETERTVNNTGFLRESRIVINQRSGTPVAWRVVHAFQNFTLHLANPAQGGESFTYEIIS